jgi:hypothetical protein
MTEFQLTTDTARTTQTTHTDLIISTNLRVALSVEEGKSAEDLENNVVTDAGMVNEEQNVPNLLWGENHQQKPPIL